LKVKNAQIDVNLSHIDFKDQDAQSSIMVGSQDQSDQISNEGKTI
jgi:hypothetical protein